MWEWRGEGHPTLFFFSSIFFFDSILFFYLAPLFRLQLSLPLLSSASDFRGHLIAGGNPLQPCPVSQSPPFVSSELEPKDNLLTIWRHFFLFMFNDFLSLASHGSLGFHSSTALLYRFLLGPLVFGFVGSLRACFFMRWWFLYLYNSGNEKELSVGLNNGKYGVKYLVGLPKR